MPELGGGAGEPLAPPIFGRSVNPIPTGGGQIIPTYYYWPPQSFSPSGITALNCEWTELEQTLDIGRSDHVVFLIPDELTSCE